jgi:xanthine dehydrogenase accessory factor
MDILHETLTALETEESVMLATILATSGSTPASAFSKMLICSGGMHWKGTVGGGCVEGDVIESARNVYGQRIARVLTFHLNEDDLAQGLICGGSLHVLIETLTQSDRLLLQEIKSLRDNGDDCVVASVLENGTITKRFLFAHPGDEAAITRQWQEILQTQSPAGLSAASVTAETRRAFSRNQTRRVPTECGEVIIEPLAGTPHLIIFGGGHVSKYVSRSAAMAGFHVTIVDDRKEYANAERFPEAVRTIVSEFHTVRETIAITQSTYIIIVTRGHRSDEDVLAQVATSDARYIGMIGSKRKVLTTYEHLVERGIPPEAFQRVHAPMGVEIGAVTPEEIGISVVAQLIRVRRGEMAPLRNKSDIMDDVVRNLAAKPHGRNA